MATLDRTPSSVEKSEPSEQAPLVNLASPDVQAIPASATATEQDKNLVKLGFSSASDFSFINDPADSRNGSGRSNGDTGDGETNPARENLQPAQSGDSMMQQMQQQIGQETRTPLDSSDEPPTVTTKVDSDGRVTEMTTTQGGRVTTDKFDNGKITTRTVQDGDRTEQITFGPNGKASEITLTTPDSTQTTKYDSEGRKVTQQITDAHGRTSTSFDTNGDVNSEVVEGNDGTVRTYQRFPDGRTVETTDSDLGSAKLESRPDGSFTQTIHDNRTNETITQQRNADGSTSLTTDSPSRYSEENRDASGTVTSRTFFDKEKGMGYREELQPDGQMKRTPMTSI